MSSPRTLVLDGRRRCNSATRPGRCAAMQPRRRLLVLQVTGGEASMEHSPTCPGAAMQLLSAATSAAMSGLQWSSARVAIQLRRSRRSSAGAAMELSRSCNGASSEPSDLRRGCNGARPELQWSFIGVATELRQSRRISAGAAMELHRSVGAALELRRGYNGSHRSCNGVRRTPSVLRWSTARGCNDTSLKLSRCVAASCVVVIQ